MKISRYILNTDDMEDYGFPNKLIVYSTRTGNSVLLDNEVFAKVKKESFDQLDQPILDLLQKNLIIVPESEDEYATIMTENRDSRESTDILSFTIQPSADCQFGCHYCGQTHKKDYATDHIIDLYYKRIKHLYEQDKGRYKGISITWYGGEPLMSLSTIKKTSDKLMEFAFMNSLTYGASMITNGLSLKESVFEELVHKYKVKDFQITLDGTADSHDQRRVIKGTRGATFDIIFNNIKKVASTETYNKGEARINIRINIDKTNHQYVDPLLDMIIENDLNRKVSVRFAPIVDWGGNDAGKDGLSKEDFAKKEIDWLLKCYDNGIDSTGLLPKRTPYACMVEKNDSEVYDAYGNIYSCWEFPYTDVYKGGEHLIGNLKSDYSTFNKDATLRNWDKTIDSGTTWCKKCVLLPVCAGGCPKSWYEGEPACPTFKINYKEKLMFDYYVRANKVLQ